MDENEAYERPQLAELDTSQGPLETAAGSSVPE